MNPIDIILNKFMQSPQVTNNPMARNAFQMYQNGDTDGLKRLAENLCRERGMTANEAKEKVMSMINH